ncbi:MAG TPA: Gfo/Idh/MocA family oxidoreductase [Chitinophagaceae bacterium]|nr:Gfo/Idh/MocA family oxidoreductase [Chitinophagaceae bacterium]
MQTFSRRSFLASMGIGTAVLSNKLSSATSPTPLTATPYTGPKLRVALCGLGNYAGYLAIGLQQSAYCKLTGIVTGKPEKAAKWKKEYNLPDSNVYNYDNFDSIADNKDIDLVYIVLPNSMHKEFVIRAAKAGKHVITEKPMAVSVAEAEEMIKACADANVQLAVGYRLHYEPYNMEMKRLGQEKVFGPVRLIETSLGYKVDDPLQWRLRRAMSGGGPLMNLGIYCLQASRYITGEEPVAVTAQFNPPIHPAMFTEVEASITWQLSFPSGAVCNSTSSYNANIDRLYAAADNGFFELAPAISYGPFKGRSSNGVLQFPDINQQAAQMDGIGQVLLQKKTLPSHISGEEGLRDMRIMEAIYAAANTGRKISLL